MSEAAAIILVVVVVFGFYGLEHALRRIATAVEKLATCVQPGERGPGMTAAFQSAAKPGASKEA